MANPRQFCLATLVEPIAETIKGTFNLIPLSYPIRVSIVTLGNMALLFSVLSPHLAVEIENTMSLKKMLSH